MSELSGAESAARQEERPGESGHKSSATRHQPDSAVTSEDVGAKEDAVAENERDRLDASLTEPPARTE